MNEEEILDKLRKMLYHTQRANECGLSNNDFKEDIEALEGILDLYNKEKIKNRKLQEELDVCYETETMLRIELNELKKKYRSSISKDKIREKIKELEKEYEEYKDSQEWEIFDETKYAYELLQELLEERN